MVSPGCCDERARGPSITVSPLTLASSHSTPPTFTIYVCSLVLRSLLASPPLPLPSPTSRPLAPLSSFADQKSSLVYSELDSSEGFYAGTADKAVRSRMNVTFRLKGGEALEKAFVKEASERGIKGVNGHRSVGGASLSLLLPPAAALLVEGAPADCLPSRKRALPGIRTSIYNAVTLEHVKTLVAFMREFREKHSQA